MELDGCLPLAGGSWGIMRHRVSLVWTAMACMYGLPWLHLQHTDCHGSTRVPPGVGQALHGMVCTECASWCVQADERVGVLC